MKFKTAYYFGHASCTTIAMNKKFFSKLISFDCDQQHMVLLIDSREPLLQLMTIVLEPLLQHLSAADCSRLSRTTKRLGFMLRDVAWLHYLLTCVRPSNATITRKRFALPRNVPLTRIARGKYLQSDAFLRALDNEKGLSRLRKQYIQRQYRTEQRQKQKARYNERLNCLSTALGQSKLPTALMWNTRPGLAFRMQCLWVSDASVPELVVATVHSICKMWYLCNYTNYRQTLEEHIDKFGVYEQAEHNVASWFATPLQWPWLVDSKQHKEHLQL
jgi:hypothetical protein